VNLNAISATRSEKFVQVNQNGLGLLVRHDCGSWTIAAPPDAMCTTSGQHSAAGGGGGAALPAATAAASANAAATAIADLPQHTVGQSAGQWQLVLQPHLSIPLLESLSGISVRLHYAATSADAHVLAAAPAFQ